MRLFSRLFFVILLSAPFLPAQTFSRTRYESLDTPIDIFVNDVNGDGKPDILTANFYGTNARVYLNRGDGTFGGEQVVLTIPYTPLAVNSADYDGDGRQDVAVIGDTPGAPPADLFVFLGNGDGTFRGPVDTQFSFKLESMGYLKATRKAKFDLVFTDGMNIHVAYNAGGGRFVVGPTLPSPTGKFVSGVSAGDFYHHGLWDIAAVAEISFFPAEYAIYLFRNNGDGTFTPKKIATVAGLAQWTNTVDLNGDGIPDLLVPFDVGYPNRGGVLALVNNGNGSSWTSRTLTVDPLFNVGSKAAQGDLNGDGLHDVVLPLMNGNTAARDAIAVFRGKSKTSFSAPEYYSVEVMDGPRAVAVGDFNRDRRMDIASVNTLTGTLDVFLNTTGCAPPAASPAVSICSPVAGATMGSPVKVKATARWDGKVVTHMRAYIDNVGRCDSSNTTQLQCSIALSKSSYTLTVNVWNSVGQVIKSSKSFNVQ